MKTGLVSNRLAAAHMRPRMFLNKPICVSTPFMFNSLLGPVVGVYSWSFFQLVKIGSLF